MHVSRVKTSVNEVRDGDSALRRRALTGRDPLCLSIPHFRTQSVGPGAGNEGHSPVPLWV